MSDWAHTPAGAWERDAVKRTLDELFAHTIRYKSSKAYYGMLRFVAGFRRYSSDVMSLVSHVIGRFLGGVKCARCGLLEDNCRDKKLLVVITNLLEGELRQRRIFDQIRKICGEGFIVNPTGRITANHIIHSMIAYYYEDKKDAQLDWDLSISDVPVLKHPENNLKGITENIANEMSGLRLKLKGNKENLISLWVHIERKFWMDELRLYWELLSQKQRPGKSYEEFFYSDYFVDLPCIILRSYLFGYILNERNPRIQDIVDIYTISEVVPYTTLSILDKEQYNRFLRLKMHYPPLFTCLFESVCLGSFHDKSQKPEKLLRSFLEWCRKEALTSTEKS